MPDPDRSASAWDNGHNNSADDEDMTELFAGSAVVHTLKAQLDKLPDLRQPRVDLLKQAMAEGRYPIQPQQIAGAMLADGALNLD